MINLLQIVDTATQAANSVVQNDANQDGSISLGELLMLGGWLMVPLIILFLLTIFLFIVAVQGYFKWKKQISGDHDIPLPRTTH